MTHTVEEKEKYQTEEKPEQESTPVCPVCGREREPTEPREEMPPSILVIRFAGPGSAQILQMLAEGIVTPEQLGAAGQFLACRAFQEWSVPFIQMVAKNVIQQFMEEVTKPKVEAATVMPPFWMHPRGGKPV